MEVLSADEKGLAEEWARGLVENWGRERASAMASHAVSVLREDEDETGVRVEDGQLDLGRAPGSGRGE